MGTRLRMFATVLTVVLVGVLMPAGVAGAGTGSKSCVDPSTNTTWRVDWSTTASIYGDMFRVSALYKRVGSGAWTSAANSTWALRWDNTPSQWVWDAFQERIGQAATVSQTQVATYLSPRLVSPDGGCTVYAYPFANGPANGRRIGVVGDSLTQSLNDPTYNATYLQGYVQGNLNANGRKAEIEGQGGRRWSAAEGSTGLARADSYLLDEIRGLRSAGANGLVVALGANDAGWVAGGSTQAERDRRLTYVTNSLSTMVTEMKTYGICVVAVTAPESLVDYWGSQSPWYYAWAAQQINNWVRWVANTNTTDFFGVSDFGAESNTHHTGSADNWFVSDNLHLNTIGKLHYTATLTQAGVSC